MTADNVRPFPSGSTAGDPDTSGVLGKLTTGDWQTLFERGERLKFKHDQIILQQGSLGESIFLVADGEVRIEQDFNGAAVELARLTSGAIFGEMSLLDKAAVSANVVADGQVEIVKLESAVVEQLIAEDGDFGNRFYHSLAVTLSRRLRAANRNIHGVPAYIAETLRRRGADFTDDPVRESLDLSPAVGELIAFIKEATDDDSPGGIKFTEAEKKRYQDLRARMDQELAEVDKAVEQNQFLPFAAY